MKKKKNTKKVCKTLTKLQLKLLNISSENQIDSNIWNPSISTLFEKPHKLNIHADDKESLQDYLDFQHNQDYEKISPQKNRINLVQYTPISNKKFSFQSILDIMNAFYPLISFIPFPYNIAMNNSSTQQQSTKQKLIKKKKILSQQSSLIDDNSDIQKNSTQNTQCKENIKQQQQDKTEPEKMLLEFTKPILKRSNDMEVENNQKNTKQDTKIIKTLVVVEKKINEVYYKCVYGDEIINFQRQAITQTTDYSTMGFIDFPITQRSPNLITGLSRGRSGSIISVNQCTKREIVSIALHEVLHILGMDHCSQWSCLNNYSYEFGDMAKYGGNIELCPLCLSKLVTLSNFDVIERYKSLAKVFAKYKLNKDAKWCNHTIKLIEKYNQNQKVFLPKYN